MKLCKREGCERHARARGMCPKHYLVWNRVMAKQREANGTRVPKCYRQLVFDALPGSVSDIMAKTTFSQRTVQKWIRSFRTAAEDDPLKARIIDWRRSDVSGPFIPIHGAGGGPDAVCELLAYDTNSQLTWQRRKERWTDEQRDYYRLKSRTNAQVRRAAKRGDPMVNALFGKTPSKGNQHETQTP